MTKTNLTLDFTFFTHLHDFYREKRGTIRQHYRDLSKRFLDWNDPQEGGSRFLRQPQFEALEIYIFLKEYLHNAKVHDIFKDWSDKSGRFEGRRSLDLIEDTEQYKKVFDTMRKQARLYPNYIFALTMGTGKTILMATCIFYEFILANKWPKDKKYCHNALVFAPDKTVLQSLRELETFDWAKVVPPDYLNLLTTHVKFHFLDESGVGLSTIDGSRFNIVVSNTQKIILKRQNKTTSHTDQLFNSGKPTYEKNSVYEEFADLYDDDTPLDDITLTENQRFEKLTRLKQLGIYIDEAHHAFGSKLAKDMGRKATATSLRTTVDELAARLAQAGTHVVACYNYTGTPYAGKEIFPEVVYAFGLKAAIDKQYLKRVHIHSYTTAKTTEFIDVTLEHFIQHHADQRFEDRLPKLALFAATIDELQTELRPAVEAILIKHGIPLSKILVNVGDDKLTSNDDIREFNRLDSPTSDKQFILLVNKGREGWNCRSLFGVALFREPKSKIFVLQATMRCLRAITNAQQTGHVYLSASNKTTLDNELQQNFRVSADELQSTAKNRQRVHIHVTEPPVKLKLRRVHRQFDLQEKSLIDKLVLGLASVDTTPYRLLHTEQAGLDLKNALQTQTKTEDLTARRTKQHYSRLTLVAEIARYLNKPCLAVEQLLDHTLEGNDGILHAVNDFNELLYDVVIPRLFAALYELTPNEQHEEYEVELVKTPTAGYYEVSAEQDKIIHRDAVPDAQAAKSFHLDTYCFDSNPERELFWHLLKERRIDKLYFTGMLTHGQSEFYVQYIDPESHAIRSYYPDFLYQRKDDGAYVIVEVKADYQIDAPIVQAKQDFAEQMAMASRMDYALIPATQVGDYENLLFGEGEKQGELGA